jgi:sugar lactone lactonase YvrE
MVRKLLWGSAIVVVLALLGAAGFLAFAPIPIEPQAWVPPPNPGLKGPYAENSAMKDRAVKFAAGLGRGPEDVAVKDGFAYTGLEDGRIMKLSLDGKERSVFAKTGGRPLGVQFDAQGNLIVADADKGLLSVAPDGKVSVLVDSIGGKKMIFVDDLDIAADGTIWFSDASQRFGYKAYLLDFWEGRGTGRLLAYNPATKQTRVALENLRFANGVAIAPDQSFVLVSETAARRIAKHWLTGPRAGRTEILIEALPGYPDNISVTPEGVFWIALPAPASDEFDAMQPKPFLRGVQFRMVSYGLVKPPTPPLRGWVIAVDGDGKVLASLMDPKGETFHTVTSVNVAGGELFLGSNVTDAIARMPVPALGGGK